MKSIVFRDLDREVPVPPHLAHYFPRVDPHWIERRNADWARARARAADARQVRRDALVVAVIVGVGSVAAAVGLWLAL